MGNMLRKSNICIIIVPECKKIIADKFPKLIKYINPYFQETLHADSMQEGHKENETQTHRSQIAENQRPKEKPSK